jgi:hypothetical protein
MTENTKVSHLMDAGCHETDHTSTISIWCVMRLTLGAVDLRILVDTLHTRRMEVVESTAQMGVDAERMRRKTTQQRAQRMSWQRRTIRPIPCRSRPPCARMLQMEVWVAYPCDLRPTTRVLQPVDAPSASTMASRPCNAHTRSVLTQPTNDERFASFRVSRWPCEVDCI